MKVKSDGEHASPELTVDQLWSTFEVRTDKHRPQSPAPPDTKTPRSLDLKQKQEVKLEHECNSELK